MLNKAKTRNMEGQTPQYLPSDGDMESAEMVFLGRDYVRQEAISSLLGTNIDRSLQRPCPRDATLEDIESEIFKTLTGGDLQ